MYTVSDLMGLQRSGGKGLAIYLADPFIRASQSGKRLEEFIGVLGKQLGKAGGVVLAFSGDEDNVLRDVLNKQWDEQERAALGNRPSLLILDKDWDDFDPSADNYLHINLRELFDAGQLNDDMAIQFFRKMNEVFLYSSENQFNNNYDDLFYRLKDMQILQRRDRAFKAVNIKFSFCGLEIDAKKFIDSTFS